MEVGQGLVIFRLEKLPALLQGEGELLDFQLEVANSLSIGVYLLLVVQDQFSELGRFHLISRVSMVLKSLDLVLEKQIFIQEQVVELFHLVDRVEEGGFIYVVLVKALLPGRLQDFG